MVSLFTHSKVWQRKVDFFFIFSPFLSLSRGKERWTFSDLALNFSLMEKKCGFSNLISLPSKTQILSWIPSDKLKFLSHVINSASEILCYIKVYCFEKGPKYVFIIFDIKLNLIYMYVLKMYCLEIGDLS